MKRTAGRNVRSRGKRIPVSVFHVHTLVIGSGAAGLNAAVQLCHNGIEDVVIVTEGLEKGTSINTGSDKQTYYKLAMCGEDSDSPFAMARTYFSGGSMHGDLALVEAALSARAFLHLVNLGLPFPRDAYGQFVGYKTDHDPRQRATSIGPYTSREMCRVLIREVKRLEIPVHEGSHVVQLLVVNEDRVKRAAGAIALTEKGEFAVYVAENVVFAAGGPGGLYKSSVYPEVHTGGIGLALAIGARARSLPESQYGMASTKFRWNVSGSYMQVIPRFISTDADGRSNAREFLRDYFDSPGEMGTRIFLKGYQWPFDSRKVIGGSSLVDILVYIEAVQKGRRVFLDFRHNPDGFAFESLSEEAKNYLTRSKALAATPIDRLKAMNPAAVALYAEHGIDLEREPLEIAVCAQHNNGGLAGTIWWESENIKHLFPVGEVNGSHGVYRPGGAALNAGQVGGFRAAEYIVNRYRHKTLSMTEAGTAAERAIQTLRVWLEKSHAASSNWQTHREEFQERMSRAGAHIRSLAEIDEASDAAWRQYRRIEEEGCACSSEASELIEALRTRYLCFAHAVYLDAIRFALKSGVGSRGSMIVLDRAGQQIHPKLGPEWAIASENTAFRDKVLETEVNEDGVVSHRWVACRPLPESDAWFETTWARFQTGAIYSEV
ncbi:MAG: FAD-binding protein [Kiritimatiellia bacterium]